MPLNVGVICYTALSVLQEKMNMHPSAICHGHENIFFFHPASEETSLCLTEHTLGNVGLEFNSL